MGGHVREEQALVLQTLQEGESGYIENTDFPLFLLKMPKLWVCKSVVWCYCESCWNKVIQHVLKYSVSMAKNKSLVPLNETVLYLLQEKSSKGEEARSLITARAVIGSHWEVIRCSL